MRVRLVVAVLVVTMTAVGCGAAEEGGDAVSRLQRATTTAPPLPDGACVARMKNPNPEQGGTATAIVDSHFPSTPVTVTAHYKSTNSTFSGSLDGNGHGEVSFSIGHPTANFAVVVDVAVADKETCQTSFTPH